MSELLKLISSIPPKYKQENKERIGLKKIFKLINSVSLKIQPENINVN